MMTVDPAELAQKLTQVEILIDTHPTLTRRRSSGLQERARFVVTVEAAPTIDNAPVCWTVELDVRGVQAKGRGAKAMSTIHGSGPNPGAAVLAFHNQLTYWQGVLK